MGGEQDAQWAHGAIPELAAKHHVQQLVLNPR
jgi:hypothetical protein